MGQTTRKRAGSPLNRRIALNIAILYAAWFGAVLSAARGWPVAAALASVAMIALNVSLAERRSRELGIVALALAIGLAVESLHVGIGGLRFAAPGPVPGGPPAWIVLMWGAFATVVSVSLGWLGERPILTAVLGAAGAPLSYLAGARLGAMEFGAGEAAGLGLIALTWAVALPVLVRLVHGKRGG